MEEDLEDISNQLRSGWNKGKPKGGRKTGSQPFNDKWRTFRARLKQVQHTDATKRKQKQKEGRV